MTEKYKRYGFDTNRRVSNRTIQQIRTHEESGVGVMESSRRLGVHPSTVRKYRLAKGAPSIPPLAEEKQLEIKKLRAEGMGTTQIAKRLGVSRNVVIKYGGPTKKHDWEEIAQKVAEYEDRGIIRRKQQAKLLGIAYNTMLYHFGPDKWSSVTVQDIMRIRTARRQGMPVRQLALEYRCSESTIYNVVNSKGRYAFL